MIRFRSFWIFPLLAGALITWTHHREPQSHAGQLLWLWPMGLALWTIIEYFFHRFLLHASSFAGATHGLHHEAPRNPDQILVRSFPALLVSTTAFGIIFAATGSLFDSAGIMTGVWTGFLYYELVHYRVHMSLRNSPLLQRQRRAHFYHHFSNSKKCFGVTSSMWDYVFGTGRNP